MKMDDVLGCQDSQRMLLCTSYSLSGAAHAISPDNVQVSLVRPGLRPTTACGA